MALVGLLESLMTAKLVDDIIDTHSDKTREGWGQGVANIVAGFFGGMGGCAMIGQTMINATMIMPTTVIVTVTTHNLAYGVILGVIVAMVFFARRVSHFTEVVCVDHPDEHTCVYAVRGVLFFASSNDLVYQFDYAHDPQNVIIASRRRRSTTRRPSPRSTRSCSSTTTRPSTSRSSA